MAFGMTASDKPPGGGGVSSGKAREREVGCRLHAEALPLLLLRILSQHCVVPSVFLDSPKQSSAALG